MSRKNDDGGKGKHNDYKKVISKNKIVHFATPQGQHTRGKTFQNRLRRVDVISCYLFRDVLKREDDSVVVDLGFGEVPITTVCTYQFFSEVNPEIVVVGTEIDPDRVRRAKEEFGETQYLQYRVGGFNVPLNNHEKIRYVRAFNIFRQYNEDSFIPALTLLSNAMVEGGIIIEGTSRPTGRFWVVNVFRKISPQMIENSDIVVYAGDLMLEYIIFSTNFRDGFDPSEFQPILPKNILHKMNDKDELITKFMDNWKISHQEFLPLQSHLGIKEIFKLTAHHMSTYYGYDINLQKKILKKGFFVWKTSHLTIF